jgi:hypothetical protein
VFEHRHTYFYATHSNREGAKITNNHHGLEINTFPGDNEITRAPYQ